MSACVYVCVCVCACACAVVCVVGVCGFVLGLMSVCDAHTRARVYLSVGDGVCGWG